LTLLPQEEGGEEGELGGVAGGGEEEKGAGV
jgi:hypothetical protein